MWKVGLKRPDEEDKGSRASRVTTVVFEEPRFGRVRE